MDPNARGSPARPARPAQRTCGSPAASASAPGSCRSALGAASALRSRRRASARCSAALGQGGAPSARRPRCTRHESEDTAWDGRRPPAPRSRRTHWAPPFRPRPASGSLSRLTLRPRAPEGRPRDRARVEGRVLMGGPGTGRGPPSVGPVCWRGAGGGRGGPQTSSPQAQPLRYWGEATEAAGATRLKCPLAPCQSVAEQVFAFHPRDSCFSGFPSRGGGHTPFTGSLIQARTRVNPHAGAPCTTTRQQRRRRPRRKVTGQRLTEASSQ